MAHQLSLRSAVILKISVCFPNRKERLVHKSQGLLNHPTETIHGGSKPPRSGWWVWFRVSPQCTTGHRQILPCKWTPQANMSSSSLTSHQCKPSLKSPNQPIGRDGRQADGYPWADELLVPSPCPRMQFAICLGWFHAWSFWSRIPSAVWTQERTEK